MPRPIPIGEFGELGDPLLVLNGLLGGATIGLDCALALAPEVLVVLWVTALLATLWFIDEEDSEEYPPIVPSAPAPTPATPAEIL